MPALMKSVLLVLFVAGLTVFGWLTQQKLNEAARQAAAAQEELGAAKEALSTAKSNLADAKKDMEDGGKHYAELEIGRASL